MKKHDIKHHLSKELLLAYSAGQLEEGFSLAIATHISMCDQCRAELESLEAVGGAIFENLEPNEICLLYTSPSPRDGLLSRMPSSA